MRTGDVPSGGPANSLDDLAVDICQAEIAAGVAVRERFMVEAQEMQHGRVNVVYVNAIFDGLPPGFIGGTVNVAAPDSPACQPDAEAVMIVVPAELVA